MTVRVAFERHASASQMGSVRIPAVKLPELLREIGMAAPELTTTMDSLTFAEFIPFFNKCSELPSATAAHEAGTSDAPDGSAERAREAAAAHNADQVGQLIDHYHMLGDVDEPIDFKTHQAPVDPTEEQRAHHAVRRPHARPEACMVQSASCSSPAEAAAAAQRAYETELIKYVQGLEEQDASDYSLGFSGTKQDTTIESSMGQLMRGGPQEKDSPFAVVPCACQLDSEGNHARDCKGRWLRCLNKSGTCYLYVHTITHYVSGVKPNGWYDPEEERRKAVLLAAGEFPDFPSCFLENLEARVREVLTKERKTPLLLAGSEELHAEVLAFFSQEIGQDKKKQPIPRGYIMDTRPMVLGQTRTGVKFEDAVKACKKCLSSSVRNATFAVVDIANQPPNFQDKICSLSQYRDMFPISVFDPKARGWRKDMLQFAPKTEEDAVLVLSSCNPADYEACLREPMDPDPWSTLSPIQIQTTPVAITDIKDLLDTAVETIASKRLPIIIDNTNNKGTVDMFWNYQRTFTIDVQQALFDMKGQTPAQDPESHSKVLQSWRRQLVGAMRQGYFLVIKMGETNLDMKDFCQDSLFPYCVFRAGSVEEEEVRDRLYIEEEMESGIAILRQGFGVVITTSQPLETFKRHLKSSIPLANMKGIVVM
eukprot:CAMPEP_0114245380 /NCGR_PEP_ID=MMETSP0058-20121206/11862_1 /TAXON_ID=36894 /ORGANISM="Pyramimonas parkeae, CCMP726" /LENGTH=651 /DNA_ID=CAMNT_0001358423 /DNA_START=170 /DNA_END=2125 /DNA_ORIENTATION=+